MARHTPRATGTAPVWSPGPDSFVPYFLALMSFFKALLASTLGFFVAMMLAGVFGVFMVIMLAASLGSQQETPVQANSVLVVEPPAVIEEYSVGLSFVGLRQANKPTLRQYIGRITAAATDADIKGIWLKLGGYGGSWAQAEELREALANFRHAGKFIYATSNVSGLDEKNYFLASVADTIALDRGSRVEMNGISAQISFFRPMLQRIGVKAEVVRAGAYKSAVEPFILDSASKENREMMDSLLNGTFARFTAAVVASRKISPDTLLRIINDIPFLSPHEARAFGLADAVLYSDQMEEMVKLRVGNSKKLRTVDLDDYHRGVSGSDEDNGGSIAIVYAVGAITRGKSGNSANPLFGGTMLGSDDFADAMQTARDDKSVKAVVLRIDSPGGDADASEAMWREVALTRKVKPVIVSMGSLAASGGYYIAAGADTIVADATTITGSIGAFGLRLNMKQLFQEKLGINVQVFKTGPHADFFSSVRELTPLEQGFLERMIDTTYTRFLNVVAEGRKMDLARVQEVAQGRVWTGQQAKARGLVDVIGGLDTARAIAARRVGLKPGGYSVVVLPREKEFIERLAEALGGTATAVAEGARTDIDRYREMALALQNRAGVQLRMTDIQLR